MTTDPRQLAERIASRLDSATYEIGKERETRLAIIAAEIRHLCELAALAVKYAEANERLGRVFGEDA